MQRQLLPDAEVASEATTQAASGASTDATAELTALRREVDSLREQLARDARERARAELQDSDSLLRRRVEATPMAAIEWRADGTVLRWAGEAEAMFGWPAAEVLGRRLDALGLTAAAEAAEPDPAAVAVAALLRGQAPVRRTQRNLTRDGRVIHCTWHHSLIHPTAGMTAETPADALPRVLSLVLDMTEHRRAEEALRASEARHRLLAETMLHGVVHHAADGRIIAINPAAERILGKDRRRLLGSDAEQEDDDTVREDGSLFPGDEHAVMQALRTGRPVHGQVMGVWNPQAGERRWIRIDAVPVPPPSSQASPGRPAEVYAVFEDITEQRRHEDALREADRQKDLFIATLAHELRNPLAPILSAAAMLRGQGDADAPAARCSAVIERQVAQMSRLLDDLLDVSRVSTGRLLLRPEVLWLADVIEQAVETARPLIDAAGHTLTVHLPPQPLPLRGDRTRLAQVCANLLTNAAKYTPTHTPPGGRIDVRAELDGSEVVVRVADNGIGLAPEHLHSVFEMFGQVDESIERAQGGLGIGLALTKGLVEMHGGRIQAHSPGRGQGSEFVVRLPALEAQAAAPAEPAPARHTAPLPASPQPGGRRILVVDDNRDAAETLSLLLAFGGHEVRTAHDGRAALAGVQAWQPDAVLLDLGLPGLSGYDVCRELRREPAGAALLIVAVSGWAQEQDRALSADAGFDAHFVKPVPHEQLEALLAARLPT